MTALTFQQRRADFEEMLNHAARVMDYNRRLQGNPEALGGSLARLADEVAGLCCEWLSAVPRVAAGESSLVLSRAVTRRALTVAAHCLQAITTLEIAKGMTTREILDATVSGVEKLFNSPISLDMSFDPRLRVQSLLKRLGDVADNWPVPCTVSAFEHPETHQALCLASVAFEALCAALAAERGLWQAESS